MKKVFILTAFTLLLFTMQVTEVQAKFYSDCTPLKIETYLEGVICQGGNKVESSPDGIKATNLYFHCDDGGFVTVVIEKDNPNREEFLLMAMAANLSQRMIFLVIPDAAPTWCVDAYMVSDITRFQFSLTAGELP